MKIEIPGAIHLTDADRKDLEFRSVIRYGGKPSAKSPFMFTTCHRCGCNHALPTDDGGYRCSHCDKAPAAIEGVR